MLQPTFVPSERCYGLIRVSENAPLIALPKDTYTHAYWDVDAYSIGYGHHSSVITRDTKWPLNQVDNQLLQDAQEACNEAMQEVRVPLTQGGIDAVTDFVYEFGTAKFADSTLLKRINSNDISGVLFQFGLWVHVKDSRGVLQVDAGLKIRRQRDIMLYQTGDWQ